MRHGVLSIGKSDFDLKIRIFGFHNKTRNLLSDFDKQKSFFKTDFLKRCEIEILISQSNAPHSVGPGRTIWVVKMILPSACSPWSNPESAIWSCLCLPSRFKIAFADESNSNLTRLPLFSWNQPVHSPEQYLFEGVLKSGQVEGKSTRQHDHPPCLLHICSLLSRQRLQNRTTTKRESIIY